jgi:hypothetical protein
MFITSFLGKLLLLPSFGMNYKIGAGMSILDLIKKPHIAVLQKVM